MVRGDHRAGGVRPDHARRHCYCAAAHCHFSGAHRYSRRTRCSRHCGDTHSNPDASRSAYRNPHGGSGCSRSRRGDARCYSNAGPGRARRHPGGSGHCAAHCYADFYGDAGADRDAHTRAYGNPYEGTHAYPYSYSVTDRHSDASPHTRPQPCGGRTRAVHCYADSQRDAYRHSDAAANGDSLGTDADCRSNRNTCSNGGRYCDGNLHSNAYSGTDRDFHPGVKARGPALGQGWHLGF